MQINADIGAGAMVSYPGSHGPGGRDDGRGNRCDDEVSLVITPAQSIRLDPAPLKSDLASDLATLHETKRRAHVDKRIMTLRGWTSRTSARRRATLERIASPTVIARRGN
jgi:hypothetical protein